MVHDLNLLYDWHFLGLHSKVLFSYKDSFRLDCGAHAHTHACTHTHTLSDTAPYTEVSQLIAQAGSELIAVCFTCKL